MAKPRESKRFIWVTWLIKLLSGDDSCEWRAWFQAHHYSDSWTRADTSFDSVRWKMEHSNLLWEAVTGRYRSSSTLMLQTCSNASQGIHD